MNRIPQRQPLAAQCVEWLRGRILAGAWAGFLPGERELCAQLQISRPTLRTALAQLQRQGWIGVAQGRRRQILKRSEHRPPAAGHAVGLLSPQPLHAVPPFVLFWVDLLREQLARAGRSLEFHHAPACYTEHPQKALDGLTSRAPAGAWVLYLSTDAMQRWFATRRVPAVVAGSAYPGAGLASVDIDYHAACRHAAAQFRARGHVRPALILPAKGWAGDSESEAGFREGCADALIVRHDGTVEGLRARLDQLLRQEPRPTALLVARSNYVLTTLCVLTQRGLRVPQDMAVVSRDDDGFLDFVTPSVARYVSRPEMFARKIFRVVQQLADCGSLPRRTIRLIPEFRKGDSGGM
ncbi:MAG: GntR family transcriptional regulator [Verrucomicrobiota bacterium]